MNEPEFRQLDGKEIIAKVQAMATKAELMLQAWATNPVLSARQREQAARSLRKWRARVDKGSKN